MPPKNQTAEEKKADCKRIAGLVAGLSEETINKLITYALANDEVNFDNLCKSSGITKESDINYLWKTIRKAQGNPGKPGPPSWGL